MSTKSFKPKTQYEPRDNGFIEGKWTIGLDVGYSAVKVFAPNAYGCFPSNAVEVSEDRTHSICDNPDYIHYVDLDTGKHWFVGEAALNEAYFSEKDESSNSICGRNWYMDSRYLVLARCGIALACLNNEFGGRTDEDLIIQTGLPPRYLKKDSFLIKRLLSGKHHFSIKRGSSPAVIFDFTIDEDNVIVMSQPAGTLFSVLYNKNHCTSSETVSIFKRPVIIMDIGHGTCDMIDLVNATGKSDYTFPEFGMRAVMDRTIEKIGKKYNEYVSYTELAASLSAGVVNIYDRMTYTSKPIDYSNILQEASSEVCDEAVTKLCKEFELNKYEYLIVTGGLGAAWFEKIRDRLSAIPNLHVIGGNKNDTIPYIYMNARGYFMSVYSRFNRKAA